MRLLFKLFTAVLFIVIFLLPINLLLAQSNSTPKRVEIDLSAQRLYAFSGDKIVYNFIISSGKTATPTPIGTFYPWIKLRKDGMQGGSRNKGTYYNLPNVPYVVYFHGPYAIHGTYWHSNFGRPMSHGCVNLRTSDMAKLYPWIEKSTPITIYGSTPRS